MIAMDTCTASRTQIEMTMEPCAAPHHVLIDGVQSSSSRGAHSTNSEPDAMNDSTIERRDTSWLLVLLAEILVFGALAVSLAQLHANAPGAYAYGARHLHGGIGLLISLALGVATISMLAAMLGVRRSRRGAVLVPLAVAAIAGVSVPVLFGLEYSRSISWDLIRFRAPDVSVAVTKANATSTFKAPSPAATVGDSVKGQAAWKTTCRACHGVAGEGIPGQGKDIRGSQFIASKSDGQLIDFIKVGRMPFDPLNTTGIQMPPKGGNPLLKDSDLRDIVAYVRTFKAPEASDATSKDAMNDQAPIPVAESDIYIPKSVIPPAPAGPPGISFANLTWMEYKLGSLPIPQPTDPRTDPHRPPRASVFFRIFTIVGALLSIQALVAVALVVRLAIRAGVRRARTSASDFQMGIRSWMAITTIWVILWPLFYLMGEL
jgi:disulfide bond formation protein DsbB